MKSWADSSDEDDDIPLVSTLQSSPTKAGESETSEEEKNEDIVDDRNAVLASLPSNPPYTAFVGNLSFDVQDAQHLAYELEKMCEFHLGRKVTAVDGRLMKDRDTGKKKGFGYVEFATVEDLATVLELNNRTELYGRKIRLDVANAPKHPRSGGGGGGGGSSHRRLNRSQSNTSHGSSLSDNRNDNFNSYHNTNDYPPEIDGSQFRGGRYRNNNSSHTNNAQDESSQLTRARPALKLAPRSKPLDSISRQNQSDSNLSIFGGAKPRDEMNTTNISVSNQHTKSTPMPIPTAILKRTQSQSSATPENGPTSNNTADINSTVASDTHKFMDNTKNRYKNKNSHPTKQTENHTTNISRNKDEKKLDYNISSHADQSKSTSKTSITDEKESSSGLSTTNRRSNDRNERRRGPGRGFKGERKSGRGNGGGGGAASVRRESKKKSEKNDKGRRLNFSSQNNPTEDGWDEAQPNGKTRSFPDVNSVAKVKTEETKTKKSSTKIMNSFAALYHDSDSD